MQRGLFVAEMVVLGALDLGLMAMVGGLLEVGRRVGEWRRGAGQLAVVVVAVRHFWVFILVFSEVEQTSQLGIFRGFQLASFSCSEKNYGSFS